MRLIIYLLSIVLSISCSNTASTPETIATDTMTTQQQLQALADRAVSDLELIRLDSLHIPRTIESDGTLKGTKSKSWTSGFYPGILWQLYGYSKNEKLKSAAMQWSAFVEKEKLDGGTHDLGFKIYCPYGNAYRITNDDKYKDVFLSASRTLITRYNPDVGAIRSWDHHEHLWKYPVIIDNMMNLEMLFEATKLTGDSTYYHIADQHAETTLKNHFRSDDSSYHVVDYNPVTGEVVKKNTHQGLNHESAWSRGQAWGLYGYTVAYRYTGKKKYLEQAEKIASFIFSHPNMPDDLIPYWDYDVQGSEEPRDVSAATVTASALYELSKYGSENSDQYVTWADKILYNLNTDKYKTEDAPFFLKHSVGSIPGEFEMDAPIIYADYYYVEALLRKSKL